MNAKDREQAAVMIGALSEAFREKPTAATYMGYEMGLDDLPLDTIKRAVTRAMRECKFMPSVAELRELAGVTSVADSSVIAWGIFAEARRVHGYYRSVTFDDPVLNATVRGIGGWMRCCEMPDDEFNAYLPKRFQETYRALARNGVSVERGAGLVGFHDAGNLPNGFAAQNPIVIRTGLPTALPARRLVHGKGERQSIVQVCGAELSLPNPVGAV